MTRASTPTLLSLDRWARILGFNPVHFAGAVGSSIWPANGSCEEVWPQHSWQTTSDIIGREEVAAEIYIAEQDIKRALGCSPGLTWETEEAHAWNPINYPNRFTITELGFGEVVAQGQRATSVIEDGAATVFSDPDGDGWDERVTITVATSVTDKRQVKVYFAGHGGDPAWERNG